MTLLLDLLLGILPDALISGSERAKDRRRLAEGRARCAIRAVRGRVLDIGTEWSAGSCTISPGHLRFVPTIGIVGERSIRVLEISPSDIDPDEEVYLGAGQTTTYVIQTEAGDLYWSVPDTIAEQARALVLSGQV